MRILKISIVIGVICAVQWQAKAIERKPTKGYCQVFKGKDPLKFMLKVSGQDLTNRLKTFDWDFVNKENNASALGCDPKDTCTIFQIPISLEGDARRVSLTSKIVSEEIQGECYVSMEVFFKDVFKKDTKSKVVHQVRKLNIKLRNQPGLVEFCRQQPAGENPICPGAGDYTCFTTDKDTVSMEFSIWMDEHNFPSAFICPSVKTSTELTPHKSQVESGAPAIK